MSETAPHLPYQAYKSKRHSQTPSNPLPRYAPAVSSPPPSRPTSFIAPTTPPPAPTQNGYASWEKDAPTAFNFSPPKSPPLPVIVLDPSPPVSNASPSPPDSPGLPNPPESPVHTAAEAAEIVPEPAPHANGVNGNGDAGAALTSVSSQISPDPSSSSTASSSSAPDDRPRKTSTFRRVPRNARPPLPSSPLAAGHARTLSSSSHLRPSVPPSEHPSPTHQRLDPRTRIQSLSATSTPSTSERPPAVSHASDDVGAPARRHSTPLNAAAVAASLASATPPPPAQHPPRTSSLAASPAVSRVPSASGSVPSRQSTPTPTPVSTPTRQASAAPYRPGFQPKGVYRPRTDEFLAVRRAHATTAGYASAERTKLARRLEKLVALHFPIDEGGGGAGAGSKGARPSPAVGASRRASSFFDLDLKSILSGGGGGKEDVRTAEQRITPWQEDSSVSKCPLCAANFHPLTNRKHHCRLCGQIICALPPRRPARPHACSVLFVVDPKMRAVEEVGEGVDYGVRRRRPSAAGAPSAAEEEKFLRGVRVCRECRPVLLRQQYQQQGMHVPTFVKLYEAFVILEKEIEDSLPQFQELILSLNHDSQPTKEASAARKRLLEAFAQYDALAKRIRSLPTPGGRGSSQERVQIAVMTRANLFLQKNMFPLQSLPTPKQKAAAVVVDDNDVVAGLVDPSSAAARTLQPLLEQEALLEGFVEEAKAQRKFEDAKTLRINLGEIRTEIERVLAAEGVRGADRGQGAATRRGR
ncbi:FYVE zinc finger-domain-containing protein [Mycena sp. CBHHK59/15]|nr:FYVE zinc finger-domain-containing protein [Mycena sp. CBHHK59/15]